MPKLFVLIGPPGAGKSTWRETFTELHPTAVVVSQDDLVEEYARARGVTYSTAFRTAPLKEFAKMVKARFVEAVARGEDIVLDRTNMSRKSRQWFLETARGYEATAIVFEAHPIVLADRLRRRARKTGKHIPQHVVTNMLRGFEDPDFEEFDLIETRRSGPPTIMQRVCYHARRLLNLR